MNSPSIPLLNKIYNNSCVCNIIRHNIVHDELYHISVALTSLRNSLGLEAEEEFWRQTLIPIRRFINYSDILNISGEVVLEAFQDASEMSDYLMNQASLV